MKKMQIKSAIPIYIAAAVWLLAGLIAPKALMKLPGFIVTILLSVGGYIGGSKVFAGRTVEVEDPIETGNAQLDRDIAEGRARLERLRQANAAIPHPEITRNLDRMTRAGEQIFQALGRDPKKYQLVRRFMNYYLPTSEKLMEQYSQLMETQVKGENIQSAMRRIESSLSMVADAFDKCADNLYQDAEMDIDAEIQVMSNMLSNDSLIENAPNTIRAAGSGSKRGTQPAAVQQEEEPGIKLTLGGH